jgi:hypothetical protein
MKIVLISNSKYALMRDTNAAYLRKLGHEPIQISVADDVSFLNLKFSKPVSVLKELEGTPEGDMLGYLDVDAFMVKPVLEIEVDASADVYLTYHGGNQRVINSGVYFLRANAASKRFMRLWCDEIEKGGSELPEHRQGDQLYLNRLIHSKFKAGIRFKNTIKDFDGIRIKFLDADVYNSNKAVYNEKMRGAAKILHFHASTCKFGDPNVLVLDKLEEPI